jgi:cytochrome c biogenesis protein CcdA/thiol-disulfide isomerase/thioredoxin
MTLFIVSFIAGVLTILAPCILPLLPVIVGRSVTDTTVSHRRLFVIIISLGLSVIAFTLLLKASTLLLNIPQDFWRWISGGIILILGVVTIFPSLWESLSFTGLINRKSNQMLMRGYQKDNLTGDMIVGASLGPIFSACSPTYFVILATVLPVRPVVGMVYLITYTFGLCLALFIVSILGQKIVVKLGIASDPRGWFKRTLGVIFVIVAIAIITGYDKKLQISILDAGFLDVTKIEQSLLESKAKKDAELGDNINTNVEADDEGDTTDEVGAKASKSGDNLLDNFLTPSQKKKRYGIGPDLSTIDGYINTDGKPITIGEFREEKVVLLDIWTYSCINCIRTLPYLNEWHQKYKDQGLVILGLHTPEFAFERIQKNVEEAVEKFKIKYPVVLDNDFSTWHAYKNRYWPRKYLIDLDGYVVYDHIGEGGYDETERQIQRALRELHSRLDMQSEVSGGIVDPEGKTTVDHGQVGSPEIYFGSARNEYFANGKRGVSGVQNLTLPTESDVKPNQLYLGGTWSLTSEHAENQGSGEVLFKYKAKDVYIVASSASGGDMEVYVDGKLTKTTNIKEEELYTVVEGEDYSEHTLMLKVKDSDVQIFAFTFG